MNHQLSSLALLAVLATTAAAQEWPSDDFSRTRTTVPAYTRPRVATRPVTVRIKSQTAAVIGDKVYLQLEETGTVSSRVWSVFPTGTIGLDTHDGGRYADFSSRFPGTYVFFVSVAGVDGSVSHTHHTVELHGELPAEQAPAATQAQKQRESPQDVPKLIRQWIAEVQSSNRRVEGLQIAGTLRQIAGGIDSGTIISDDLMRETRATCALALGARYTAWSPWFDHLEELFKEFDRLQVLPTPAHFAAALRNVAQLLEQS